MKQMMSAAAKKAIAQGKAQGEVLSISKPTITGIKASPTHEANINEAVAEASVSKP